MDFTTIKLNKKTKARLDNLKVFKRETYDEILIKMLNLLNICRINPEEAKRKLLALEAQRR